MLNISEKAKHLKQSGIRAASQKCAERGGINLGQGVCNLPTPDAFIELAYHAMKNNNNTYSACEGVTALRQLLAKKIISYNHIQQVTAEQVMVSHGSTGAFICAVQALLNPGDEVILFEPFYGYHRNILELFGMSIATLPINLNDFSVELDDLEKCVNKKTKAIIICTPCNPCGKVFSREELIHIGQFAERHNLVIITDEIYEYITYPGFEHISIASLNDFYQRTVTISGFSKTYNMTGWRLGYASAPKYIIEKMALIQDLIYVCPVTPLQHAGIAFTQLPDYYFQQMQQLYLEKREIVVSELHEMGFQVKAPDGAYYLMVHFDQAKYKDCYQIVDSLFEHANVALVPGTSFYLDPKRGLNQFRLCYALSKLEVSQALSQMKQFITA